MKNEEHEEPKRSKAQEKQRNRSWSSEFLPEGFRRRPDGRRSETWREAQSPSLEAPVVRERSRALQSERRREGERERQRDWAWLGVQPEKANWTVKQKEVVGTFGIRFWGSDWK